ncbi:bifunctional ADP-dependent NAD(P)H-hydrate dehydratase/NAD(P)H-hydrate epimerase [Enteractinococcus coprophilus]|uniref:ADP-dependent (S)-NAD(P)H-hydrate dehydratase n=1 Tax=Enteractinococcus coprophilus TaxID=1027633 RepID=A0A543A0U2_9MICC|nr:bifunctional ADP-dependent NAD(P)H-hydrate dehydratase/NAD(P)H-hydrate epimerase [Enteractinococcus coprophilus]TQL66096.1 hydroxyethylthiazole kinase-like uncharacterized protein yjeF/hydroxyethylthiazole kinase-like uncharacterized protein yjeF [Enteractinococcus coprophilus]
MRRCYTGTQIRAAEQSHLDVGDGPVLMRRAAWGLAHHTLELLNTRGQTYGSRVIGLIGKGNNGGDTLWALSFLAKRGAAIAAIPTNSAPCDLHPEGLAAFHRAGGRFVERVPTDTAAVIDGVFGTGFRGSFDLPQYLMAHNLHLPDSAAVIACDIPSGVLADTGVIPGRALAADLTVTFAGPKVGLLADAGRQHSGTIRVVDIGINDELTALDQPWWLAEEHDVVAAYGPPAWDAHKYSHGVLSVVAGSAEYPGAAVLVVNAATATGVGYLSLVAEPPRGKTVADKVLATTPQAVVTDQVTDKATAVVIGPGLGATMRAQDATRSALQAAIRLQIPALVDASGLDVLEPRVFDAALPALVLTPHVGEMQRLTTRLAPDLVALPVVEQAAACAKRFGVWVVLKSATTYVFSPTGLRSLHPARTAELATAGTGDTLAGILGAGLSRLKPSAEGFMQRLFSTLSAGVRLHSMAGELAAADGGVVVSTLEHYIRQAKQQSLE